MQYRSNFYKAAVQAALFLLGPWMFALSAGAQAQMVVVMGAQSGVEQLSKTQVVNIFMGKSRELPNGIAARPVDLPAGPPDKANFYHMLVNKDLDQIAAYWSRLIFSGSTAPPLQASSVQDALQFVTTMPGAVAYLDRRHVDHRVKVVHAFQ